VHNAAAGIHDRLPYLEVSVFVLELQPCSSDQRDR